MSESGGRYVVVCDECGVVSFDVLEHDWFGNEIAAMWYSGYHSGKEHPESDRQLSFPEKEQDV